jgi:integrase
MIDIVEPEVGLSSVIEFTVESSAIENYIYRRPLISVDENGECVSEYRKNNKGVLIKQITLLNVVGSDAKGRLQSFEPLEVANQFLLSNHIDDGLLESAQASQGLALFFNLILSKQRAWDSEYDKDTFDERYDDPRPSWDRFPKRKPDRLTFEFRDWIKQAVLTDHTLSASTAKAYHGVVIRFYKYWLRRGYQFNNPPFEHEVFNLRLEAGASSMNSYYSKEIHTTDCRLTFGKSSRAYGTSINGLRRDLAPFEPNEWAVLQNILMKTRRVIRNKDESKLHSLPIECCLLPMICRYTGLRREEAASLHLGQIVKPEMIINDAGKQVYKKPVLPLNVGDGYGSLTKDKSGGNKPRKTIIPAHIMHELYKYTQSPRYKIRLAKYKAWCTSQIEQGNTSIFEGDDAIVPERDYLFIAQTGNPMVRNLAAFTGRWGEVRDTANHTQILNGKLFGSLHNLRATFAVNVFKHLLKTIKPDDALDRVSLLLGHEDLATTLIYLKLAQDAPSGDEIYEDALDYLGVFDELEL